MCIGLEYCNTYALADIAALRARRAKEPLSQRWLAGWTIIGRALHAATVVKQVVGCSAGPTNTNSTESCAAATGQSVKAQLHFDDGVDAAAATSRLIAWCCWWFSFARCTFECTQRIASRLGKRGQRQPDSPSRFSVVTLVLFASFYMASWLMSAFSLFSSCDHHYLGQSFILLHYA